MLLKRLSWPAMVASPDFLTDQHFLGFYFNARELSDLQGLFSNVLYIESDSLATARSVTACFGTLHILHSIADDLKAIPIQVDHTKAVAHALLQTANRCLSPLLTHELVNTDEMVSFIADQKADIISAVGSPERLQQTASHASFVTQPEQTFGLFARFLKRHIPIRTALLIDQYEWLAPEAQTMLNPLLKRAHQELFFTVVACRPFVFHAQTPSGTLQPGEDFRFTLVEYLPEDRMQYEELLSNIWEKVRPLGDPIGQLLEGGISLYADMSSRSVRRFLDLCAGAGALDGTGTKSVINYDRQVTAALELSHTVRDDLKVVSGIPLGEVWQLMLLLRRLMKDKQLPAVIRLSAQSGLPTEGLSRAAENLLRKAFEEAALQFLKSSDASATTLPESFTAAKILGPSLGLPLNQASELLLIRLFQQTPIAWGHESKDPQHRGSRCKP